MGNCCNCGAAAFVSMLFGAYTGAAYCLTCAEKYARAMRVFCTELGVDKRPIDKALSCFADFRITVGECVCCGDPAAQLARLGDHYHSPLTTDERVAAGIPPARVCDRCEPAMARPFLGLAEPEEVIDLGEGCD